MHRVRTTVLRKGVKYTCRVIDGRSAWFEVWWDLTDCWAVFRAGGCCMDTLGTDVAGVAKSAFVEGTFLTCMKFVVAAFGTFAFVGWIWHVGGICTLSLDV